MTNAQIELVLRRQQLAFLAIQKQLLLLASNLKIEEFAQFDKCADECLNELEKVKAIIEGASAPDGDKNA